jgi:transcriptional regulator with XRE-family HTH domain
MKINGETLRNWRTIKKMKQSAVAEKLNVSQQAFSKWENIEIVSNKYLQRFIQATCCSHEELVKVQEIFTPPA